ncbi:hypothetical protein GIB67_003768 [Kingdonia uniflora]|uniref:Uncharacterized protein n=1 Tax=Kingdonia uniflora TaxID=39325 RepID=A0A7J7P3V3_9MAGN|nr:hypothetical protein GIB67_003768 [Kingdonia uniflora]
MKQSIKCQRILILSLIFIFVLAPIILFSVFTSSFVANENFVEDLSTIKYKTDTLKLRSLRDRQELGEDFNEPVPVVYVDQNLNSVVRV